MSVWAIVPVKPLASAKSRLAGRLDAAGREQLSRDLLGRTLRLLAAVDTVAETIVVSPDPAVLTQAVEGKALPLPEAPPGGLNGALAQAAAVARGAGAGAIVVVPIDLPLARPADVLSAVALVAAAAAPAVVAAPDRHGRGTNLLALRPPDVIPFCFGTDSLARHRAAALTGGIAWHTLANARLALDVDEPADLALVGLA